MCLPLKPFKIEREWKHAGLSCTVVIQREHGHRCGYVRVPPGHPFHGKSYEKPNVDVHGGLTFGGLEPCSHEDGQGYWFGFDCVHVGDAMCNPDVPTDYEWESEKDKRLWHVHQETLAGFPRDSEHYW